MFSPAVGTNPHAPSVRTSRRRARPLSNDGSIPKAKRQRSTLSDQTFAPPEGQLEIEETKNYKTVAVVRHESPREVSGPQKDIAVRGKKPRSGDRSSKGDGSVILTTNDTYTVSKLPALPECLRADVTGRQHGAIYYDTGYALTLTRARAIVWPYTVNIPSPETFTFDIPHPSKDASDPLPLGSLVSASASSSEPGLVVVIPTTGRITYWESVASAATLDLRLQRSGVELTIPGMHSGETIIQILNAESAGFMLAFSTGRIAYMSVRDGQSRSAITVQFLRGSSGSASSGIFGSLRNALSSSAWRGDIAAVRAARLEKVGERNVVLATAKGKIQSWDIHRGGHTTLNTEAEGRESIVLAIKAAIPALSELLLESFEVLDFTFIPKSPTDAQLSSQGAEGVHLLVLTSLTNRDTSHYCLVEVILRRDELEIGNVRLIKSYTTPLARAATSKPRLYLPNPALVAYAIFDRAVVIISMAKPPDSPDSQLMAESYLLPQSFEDVIDFRDDMDIEIVGSGMEEPQGQAYRTEDSKLRRHKAKHPAAVLIIRGGGVVRVAATDITKLTSNQSQQVTAKTKLEQAVFFGTLDHNPISFSVRPELQFSAKEIGEAALELSQEILRSQTPYIPSLPVSIDQNLRKRSSALRELADYLKSSRVRLDRVTRWKLLWDAERMKAATMIWKRYDLLISEKPAGKKRGLLTEVVEFIHEEYKTEPVAEAGELDRIRHWFIHDIWNLEIALPWAFQVIKYAYQDSGNNHNTVREILSEANDLVIGALKTAFQFRTDNLQLYGLQAENLELGILKDNYKGLPEIWTSTSFTVENLRKQLELARLILTWTKSENVTDPPAALMSKLTTDFSTLIDISIRSSTERIQWNSVQESPQFQIQVEELKGAQAAAQDKQIMFLAEDLQLPDIAVELAEKHAILPTLASILTLQIVDELSHQEEYSDESGDRDHRIAALQKKVRYCFTKFGNAWADAYYNYQISNNFMRNLLDSFPDQRQYLSTFLHDHPEYANIAWIHEITKEKNFDQAAESLLDLGLNREEDVWSKKIGLSIGKLARLAGKRYSQENGILIPDGGRVETSTASNQLGLIKVQDTVYEFVRPFTEGFIDQPEEIVAVQNTFCYQLKLVGKQSTFLSLLEKSLAHLVKQEAMDAFALIDLLTLMGDDRDMFLGHQFYLALQAAHYGVTSKDEQRLLQRVIWRRCMLRDDWAQVNDTDMKDDQQVKNQLRNTALYLTFRSCLTNGLFDNSPTVNPIDPQDVLGACTDDLDHRFDAFGSNEREEFMKNFRVEDDAFKVHLEKSRLEKWHVSVLDLAKQDFVEEVAEKTDDGMKMKEARRALEAIESRIAEKEKGKAESLLHSKPRYKPKGRMNGRVGNFRSSLKLY